MPGKKFEKPRKKAAAKKASKKRATSKAIKKLEAEKRKHKLDLSILATEKDRKKMLSDLTKKDSTARFKQEQGYAKQVGGKKRHKAGTPLKVSSEDDPVESFIRGTNRPASAKKKKKKSVRLRPGTSNPW